MASNTLDFPELCPPTTTICGRSKAVVCPKAPNTSCSFDAMGIRSSMVSIFLPLSVKVANSVDFFFCKSDVRVESRSIFAAGWRCCTGTKYCIIIFKSAERQINESVDVEMFH